MASNMLRSTLLKNLRTVRPVPVGTALPARTLTTSPYLLAKSSKPTTPPAGSKKKASLAERPSDVPDSISSPGNTEPVRSTSLPGTGETFEPIVNDMRTSEGPHPVDSSATVDPTHTPTGEASNTTTNTAGTTTKTAEEVPLMVPEEPYQIPDKPDLSKLPSLDIGFDTPRSQTPAQIDSPESEGSSSGTGPSGRTGAKAKPSLSSIEQRRRNFTRFLLLSGLVGSGVGAYVLANKEDDRTAGEEALGAWERFKNNLSELMDTFNKPAFDKLLPDPLPAPHQRPFTLLIDLEDMLVHSAWDRQGGWRTAKRPGVDYFLAYLSQFYEIVLFTSQPLYTALPVAEKLDPFQAYLPYKLFRESTRYVKGKVVKDLTYLNRDLSKVILLDTNADHAAAQPENGIIIPKWDGTPGDKGLIDMIPFLESIGIFNPPDVRPIIKAYEGKDIPVEYAKREAERKQAAIAEWERDHGASSSPGSGWIGRALGGLSGQPVAQRPTQPMTYLEQKRAQAQALYREEQEYWRKNADEIKRLIEDDRQKQLAEQKGSLMSWMTGKPAPPPEGQQPAIQ